MAAKAQRIKQTKRNARALRNIKWIEEYCLIPEGRLQGKPLKLTSHQKEWLIDLYDDEIKTRKFIISVGRKNGKTALIACLLLLHICGPEAQQNSQLYSGALTREQAAIVFKLAHKMVLANPLLTEVLEITPSTKRITCPELGTVYQALAAEASHTMGLSPAFFIIDEAGQIRGPQSEFVEALETATAAQANPLSIYISTQAAKDGDFFSRLIDDALTGADPHVKVRLYTAPTNLDPFSIEAIKAANPHFDELMNKKEVTRMAEEARRMPTRENSYRNLVLNQRVEALAPFISFDLWKANGKQPIEDWGDNPVYGGLDLSNTRDLTALVLISRINERWHVKPFFWLPAANIAEKSREDKVPYNIWADQGYLNLTPGNTVGYDFVTKQLLDIFDTYNIKKIAYDRYNIDRIKRELTHQGAEHLSDQYLHPFGQGFLSMSPAIKELMNVLLNAEMNHGNHPVLTMCSANTTTEQDAAENIKFVKTKERGRIDGMVALAMALGVATSAAAHDTKPPKRGSRNISAVSDVFIQL